MTTTRGDDEMVISKGLLSSDSCEWETPQYLFDALNAEFGFTLDPCSTHENAKCKFHYTISDNGLSRSWRGHRVFVNPPYGRVIKDWVSKAYRESREGALVVCLVPARTDTAWWHDYVMKADEIKYIRGRLKFNGPTAGHSGSAPFPSAIVIFGKLSQCLTAHREMMGGHETS
jgi:phage N-6-adenine-methyltransferase